jgi:anaerobic selenocysteine-containing dehydrogenase
LGYDLERSDYILSIGANLLETWGNVVRNRRIFASSHPHPQKGVSSRATLVYAGPVQNNTAAVADSWLPVSPGSGIVLALGIAHLLISGGRNLPASDFGAFAQMTADYDLAAVALATGLSPETISKVVDGLLSAKAPLVILGGEFNQGAGAAPIMAGFAVNALLGNINAPGGLRLLPRTEPVPKIRSELYSRDLAAWMGGEKKEGRPAVLIIHEANPAFALPNPKAVAAFLKDVPFKAAFSAFMDETAELCDLVLPIPMGLERMDDVCNPYGCGTGIYCATLPVVSPGADARFTDDVLLFLARQIGLDFRKWRCVEFHKDLIRRRIDEMRANFDVLTGGFPVLDESVVDFRSCSLRPDILTRAARGFLKAPKLSLAVWSKLNLGTPSTGIPPFNTKTLRSTELDGGDMFALINSATAKAHGIRDGRLIRISAGSGRVRARARVFEGIVDNALALCLGYGHTAFDGFSRGKGDNVMELLRVTAEEGTGLTVWHRADVEVSNA